VLSKICPVCKTEYGTGEIFCPNDGARLNSESQALPHKPIEKADPLLGAIVDERYRVLRRIGEGGMGIVYEVEHVVIEKRLALKVLRDDYSSRPDVVARFRQEARSASRIGNEHIVDISDFGETVNKASYFVMEMLDGEDLANVLSRDGTIPLSRAADILTQCARALSAAHAKGIVHRDMKPENIFLITRENRPDFVKIVDFGIAKMSDVETDGQPGRKLTKTGMIFGTPEYMSPEQAAGKSLDHRVDIYALGVICFEMLTGSVPFSGDTFMGVLTQHMFEPPPSLLAMNPNVRVPDAMEAFIQKALAKDANDRFQTCEEFVSALDAAGRGVSPSSPPPSGARRTQMGYGESRGASGKPPTVRTLHLASDEEMATKPPSNSLLFLGIGLIAVAIAGGGFYWYAPLAPTNNGQTTNPLEAPDAGLSPALPDAYVESPDAYLDEDAGPAMVEVGIVSMPAGARVALEGSTQACDAPCTLSLPEGAHARLVATLRGRTSAVEADIVSGMPPLIIRIRGASGASNNDPGEETMTGMGVLLVPDIFRQPL